VSPILYIASLNGFAAMTAGEPDRQFNLQAQQSAASGNNARHSDESGLA
jgi:hypothetical protein